jgi:hypothetical protein
MRERRLQQGAQEDLGSDFAMTLRENMPGLEEKRAERHGKAEQKREGDERLDKREALLPVSIVITHRRRRRPYTN